MNFKTTIVLLLLLLVVGAYFLLIVPANQATPRRDQQTANQRDEPLFTVDTLETESVISVTIEHGGKIVVLEKQGADWYQTQPVRFRLNTWSGSQFVDDAATLRYTERSEPGTNGFPTLDQLGLDPPQAVVTLASDGQGPAPQTLRLGRKGVGGRGYVMRNDEPYVYVVNDALHRLVLDNKPTDWRRKSLTAPDESQADRVTLALGDRTIELIKTDAAWSFGPPHSGRADRNAVQSLLTAISDIYINEFVTDAPADLSLYGLTTPSTVVTVQAPSAESPTTQPSETESQPPTTIQTLTLGAPADLKSQHYFATWSPHEGAGDVVFTVPKSSVQKFDKTVDDLRDPRISVVDGADVHQLTIASSGADAIALERGPGGWAFVDPGPGYEADDGEVADLVDTIVKTKADAYAPDAKPDAEPLATITFTAIGRPEPETLKVYTAADETRLVLRNTESTGYIVPADSLAVVFKPVLSLRKRQVLDIGADTLTRLTITRPDGLVHTFSRDDSNEWQLAGYEKFESEAFDALLGRLQLLRAARWLDATSRHWPPLTVLLELADESSITLTINPTTRTATASHVDAPFEIDEAIVAQLSAEFRDRTLFAFAIDEIASVAVTTSDGTTTIQKENDQYVSAEGATVDQAAAGALFDALAGLRVERYVYALHMRIGWEDIAATITVKTKSDETYMLHLAGIEGHTTTATIDPPRGNGLDWFTLEQATVEKLRAGLIEAE